MNLSIFKAYDIRGIYPSDVNTVVAEAVGKVCAEMLDAGKIIVAHDIRHGSPELAQALQESLLKEVEKSNKNIEIIFVGNSTTPMFYFLVNYYKASGGCMITASHNPKNYNGIKVVGPGASMIQGTAVLKVLQDKKLI